MYDSIHKFPIIMRTHNDVIVTLPLKQKSLMTISVKLNAEYRINLSPSICTINK